MTGKSQSGVWIGPIGGAILFCSLFSGPVSAETLVESVSAGVLVLRDIAGDVRLMASEDDRLHLDLSWDAPLRVDLTQEDGRAEIVARGWPGHASGAGTVVVGRNSRVAIGEGATSSVVIGGDSGGEGDASAPEGPPPRLTGTISLPDGTALELAGAVGRLSGDAVLERLDGKAAGAPDIGLTVHGPVSMALAGGGRVRLDGVRGAVTVSLTGASDMQVSDCRVTTLTARLTGAGRVALGCPVDDADVTIMGAGEVRVPAVTGSVRRTALGGHFIIGQ